MRKNELIERNHHNSVRSSKKGLRIDQIIGPNPHTKSGGVQKKKQKMTPSTSERKVIDKLAVRIEKGELELVEPPTLSASRLLPPPPSKEVFDVWGQEGEKKRNSHEEES